jgi:hydroxyacylglutathione hydrolase
MLIREFVDEGLGNTAYLVAAEEGGEAAVVDPQRDVDRYVQAAEGLGLRLRYALETHLHNDFVSGGRELAAAAGVQVGASAEARLGFEHVPLPDGATLPLGALTLGVLATPGHTPEHISFTLTEGGQTAPSAVFTGGALMVGGAARTDLLGEAWTAHLARQLYHSLHDRLLALPDTVRVYPTHGAGSFCAAPVAAERTTTIGRERATNMLAQARSEADFVALATAGLPTYPTYFREMRAINIAGPRILGGVPAVQPLSVAEVQAQMAQGAALVDLRRAPDFARAHIPGAYSVRLREAFGTWVGWVVPFGTPLVLVGADDPARREAATRQLIRIGYDNLAGYLEGGMEAWQAAGRPTANWQTITIDALHAQLAGGAAPAVMDVRQLSEWEAGHIPGAIHVEAGQLTGEKPPIEPEQPVAVHCAHHDRSATALSLLERRGYRDLTLIVGGMSAWEDAGYETEK